ncbi:MAG: 3-hydroxyacyl-ACP dehydratase FabZ [Desulfovermiculus sp.]
MKMTEAGLVSTEILGLLPHRYPFLLVDKVVAFEPDTSLEAIKNVTINEPFFQGHFPGYPVMPGVLIVEALAQAGGILVIKSQASIPENKIFLFSGIEKMRFRKPVYPGDCLHLFAASLRHKQNIWKMEVEARVDGLIAAQGVLTAAMVDRNAGQENDPQ